MPPLWRLSLASRPRGPLRWNNCCVPRCCHQKSAVEDHLAAWYPSRFGVTAVYVCCSSYRSSPCLLQPDHFFDMLLMIHQERIRPCSRAWHPLPLGGGNCLCCSKHKPPRKSPSFWRIIPRRNQSWPSIPPRKWLNEPTNSSRLSVTVR